MYFYVNNFAHCSYIKQREKSTPVRTELEAAGGSQGVFGCMISTASVQLSADILAAFPTLVITTFSHGEGNGNPLQYSCLENPMDRGVWQATVLGVTRVGYDLVTKPPPPPFLMCCLFLWYNIVHDQAVLAKWVFSISQIKKNAFISTLFLPSNLPYDGLFSSNLSI